MVHVVPRWIFGKPTLSPPPILLTLATQFPRLCAQAMHVVELTRRLGMLVPAILMVGKTLENWMRIY